MCEQQEPECCTAKWLCLWSMIMITISGSIILVLFLVAFPTSHTHTLLPLIRPPVEVDVLVIVRE